MPACEMRQDVRGDGRWKWGEVEWREVTRPCVTPVWHLEWKFSLNGGEGINHTPAA